jgi:hypothetical protein
MVGLDLEGGKLRRSVAMDKARGSRVIGRIGFVLPLVVAFSAALLLGAGAASAKDHQYVGVKKCKTCHKKEAIGNQYGKWMDAEHSKAYDTLASEDAKKLAAKKGIDDPQKAGECLKCHVTAYDVAPALVAKKFDVTKGVQCESCHGAGKDYRKKKIMVDQEKSKARGLIIPDEKLCLECHNDESPSWDPSKYTLANGSKAGFDFEQAKEKIAHPVPEDYDPEADKDDEEEED